MSGKGDFFNGIAYDRMIPDAGKVLISEPFLFDPHFKRTVVLLVEHSEDGSIGFILNRPANLPIHKIVEDFPTFDSIAHIGGPVNQDNLFFIHCRPDILEDGAEIIPGLFWGGDFEQLKYLVNTQQIQPNEIRFFVGYSGWDIGQLDEELAQNSWITSEMSTDDIMNLPADEMWKSALTAIGKKYGIMANFPEDPSLN